MPSQAVLLALLASLAVLVTADFQISVNLTSAGNPDGKLFNGNDCDLANSTFLCKYFYNWYTCGGCDLNMDVCLSKTKPCESAISVGTLTHGDGSFTFQEGVTYKNWPNPNTIVFTDQLWEGLNLFLGIYDYDSLVSRQTIDQIQYWLNASVVTPGINYQELTIVGARGDTLQPTKVKVGIRMKCMPHFGEDNCILTSCANGGTILNDTSCTCPSLYDGSYCQDIICLNGGVSDGSGCRCLGHFGGTHCENVICENGGQSINGVCQCANFFHGNYCESVTCTFGGTPNSDSTACLCPELFTGKACQFGPMRHCKDLFDYYNMRTNGAATIVLGNGHTLGVFCDQESDQGGWTAVQRRIASDPIDFDRTWDDYASGFGSTTGSYWLGNENILQLTSGQQMQLMVDVTDCLEANAFQIYDSFKIGNSSDYYRLEISTESAGTAGDSINFDTQGNNENGMMFTTSDSDNDAFPINCATLQHGGWWLNGCGVANLNGKYYDTCEYDSNYADGITWYTWKYAKYSLRGSMMKIKPFY